MNLQKDLKEFVELLNALVSFEEAWSSREVGELGGISLPFISREMLKRNKAATGRSQDLADLEHL